VQNKSIIEGAQMRYVLSIHYSHKATGLKNLKEEWNSRGRTQFAFVKILIVIVLLIVLFTNHLKAKNFNAPRSIPTNPSLKLSLTDQSEKALFFLDLIGGYIIKGLVRDSLSGEPLPYALVFIKEFNIGAETDFEGRYLLKIPENISFDSLFVRVSFVGYYPNQIVLRRKQLIAGGNFFYNFNMVEQPLVSIPPPGPYYDVPRIKPLMAVVSKEEIERMPAPPATHLIKGVVYDSITNEPMAFAVIKLMNTNIMASTDFNGCYQLNIPDSLLSNPLVFIISYVGYEVPQFEVKKEELPLVKDIYLKPLNTSLSGVGDEKSRKQMRRERRQLRRERFIIYPD
jgi:CarboxypepD_reg-like domain